MWNINVNVLQVAELKFDINVKTDSNLGRIGGIMFYIFQCNKYILQLNDIIIINCKIISLIGTYVTIN